MTMMYDVAAAIDKGRRDHQEDALAIDFSGEDGAGFVVLADGMGGHDAGDIASRIAVMKVSGALREQLDNRNPPDDDIPEMLRAATLSANRSIASYVSRNSDVAGMGTTLVAPVLSGDRLHWVSVGDSPLFLFSDGELHQINEDHSLGPQIDLMMKSGMLDEETARHHPDRNCLTSVLMGAEIPKIDCGRPPVILRPGDIVIVSSDGLQFLSNGRIGEILNRHRHRNSEWIANALMQAIHELNDPDQDNVSLAVIRVFPHSHGDDPHSGQKNGSAAPPRRAVTSFQP